MKETYNIYYWCGKPYVVIKECEVRPIILIGVALNWLK